MKKISEFLSENFQFLVVKFSIYMYLNRLVFVMERVKGQVNTIKVMSRRSVYLTTLFIGRRTCTHSFAKTDNHLGEISSSNFDLISLWKGRTGCQLRMFPSFYNIVQGKCQPNIQSSFRDNRRKKPNYHELTNDL